MKLIKLTLTIWDGRISPVLDVARRLLVMDVEGDVVKEQREEMLPGDGLYSQAQRLVELVPDVLICGAVSRPLATMLTARGIKIIPFVAGSVDDVLQAWLSGRLDSPALAMPGCCRRNRRQGGTMPGRGGRGRFGVR